MTRNTHFNPRDLRDLLHDYVDALHDRAREIDRINVFPVADADTGSNMLGTMRVVVESIRGVDDDMRVLARTIGSSALRGAQGNSGVILSQWLRGFVGHLAANGEVGPRVLAASLDRASTMAYDAVDEPREGTMLSVARRAAEEATVAATGADTVRRVWTAASEAGDAALVETTGQIETLRRHGVVDSGAYGLAILFDVAGSDTLVRPPSSGRVGGMPDRHTDPASPAGESGWYEVMLLLDTEPASDPGLAALRAVWREIGDSMDISGEGDTWACHVHVQDVGAAIEAAVRAGRPHHIRVTPVPPPEDGPEKPPRALPPDAAPNAR
ncbi:MAG: DAK2 domain-containing protein [Acidimicrobiia bacterium]|nr:DAK2 domain-containing protein [Acidimicrobiia bacterium]